MFWVLLFVIKLIHKFVPPDKCPSPADPGAAVDQDGLGVVLGLADCPDGLHHVQHDLGVLWSCEVSPLFSLQVGHFANLSSVPCHFDCPGIQIVIQRMKIQNITSSYRAWL